MPGWQREVICIWYVKYFRLTTLLKTRMSLIVFGSSKGKNEYRSGPTLFGKELLSLSDSVVQPLKWQQLDFIYFIYRHS